MLVGQPKDVVSWSCVHDDAFGILEDVASKLYFSDEERSHRRGFFPSIAHGISFGGGQCVRIFNFLDINPAKLCQQEPQYLKHPYEEREAEMEALMKKPSIQRICKFASSTLRKLYPVMQRFDMMNHIQVLLKPMGSGITTT